MKIKTRYIAAAVVIAVFAILTPFAIAHAYAFRGYIAFGGEYLLIPLGLIIAYLILTVAKEQEERDRGREINAKFINNWPNQIKEEQYYGKK